MSAYVIDFSDPLKNGFSIPAGGFNGPGGSNANTTLRLYGRGALEWGEAVDEDLVRLTENFASASAPSVATAGQLWAEVTLYYHNTSLTATTGWYFYDVNSVAANKWTLLNGTGIVSTVVPVTPVIGQYYLDTATDPDTLYGYYSLGRYEPAAFVARSYMTGAGAPVSPAVIPRTTLRVRDAAAGVWASPSTTTAAPTTTPPTNPQQGQLWYDTTTGNLLVWTGTAWQEILGPTGSSTSIASGNVDLGNFKIVNLGTPTANADAATKLYVDNAVTGVGGFLPLTGGTLSVTVSPGLTIDRTNAATNSVLRFQTTGGSVYIGQGAAGVFAVDGDATLSTAPWLTATASAFAVTGSVTAGTSLSVTTSAAIGTSLSVGTTATIGSTLTMSGQINMTTNRIINLGTPVSNADAATKLYVDNAVAGGGGSAPVIITTFAGSPATYKAGDIAINAGKIYIANAGGTNNVVPPAGNWKQVFPAVYA